jgi:hypothetical protein
MEKAKALSIDVAIIDIDLNGQRTFPIANALEERGIAFVFATGYGSSALPESLCNTPTLRKPFQQRDVERALEIAMNAPRLGKSGPFAGLSAIQEL